jgi:hypothetical protein
MGVTEITLFRFALAAIAGQCDPRATAFAACIRYGAIHRLSRGECRDDDECSARRQTVFAESFRMVGADRQRGTLRVPHADLLIGDLDTRLPRSGPAGTELSNVKELVAVGRAQCCQRRRRAKP